MQVVYNLMDSYEDTCTLYIMAHRSSTKDEWIEAIRSGTSRRGPLNLYVYFVIPSDGSLHISWRFTSPIYCGLCATSMFDIESWLSLHGYI